MNKRVTNYIFPHSSFQAEHNGDIYFHVQQFLPKLEGLLQPHVSLFIPPPYPLLLQYIPFYEERRNIKTGVNLSDKDGNRPRTKGTEGSPQVEAWHRFRSAFKDCQGKPIDIPGHKQYEVRRVFI